jgi:NAD-dependent dihydropyrimidine dehydrogenase PreA subunit
LEILEMTDTSDSYRKLREHLDTMPVGFPATKTGVEINLLMEIFTSEQAEVATHLNYKHKSIDQIFETAKTEVGTKDELTRILDEIVAKGGITRRIKNDQKQYAVIPLALWGMYEHQLKRLSPEFLMNFGQYIQNEFGYELATSKLPKMRVIPVEKSIKLEHKVSTYDELRFLINQAGDKIAVQNCICRNVNDMQGKHCQLTERREVCMSFGDLAELYITEGWGRKMSREEAIEISHRNEEDGLVLMPGNAKEARFMCACCRDCCGMLSLLKFSPRPADAVASNYYARVKTELCKGSGTCVARCQMEAVKLENHASSVDLARCIGCGLCVPTCPENAMVLVKKAQETIPPETEEGLFDEILEGKRNQ